MGSHRTDRQRVMKIAVNFWVFSDKMLVLCFSPSFDSL